MPPRLAIRGSPACGTAGVFKCQEGQTPEEHHQCFQSLQLPKVGHPFAYVHQLKGSFHWCLMAEERDTE